MRDALINHGCVPNKSLTLKPPKNIPKELNIYWILGYFDGDGCISVYISREKYLRLKTSFTGTYEVLDFIKKELKWKSTIRKEHRCENTYNISATEGPSQNFLNLVYNDASKEFCLERKYKKYQYYLEEKLARSMK